jgi:hypothetical protein
MDRNNELYIAPIETTKYVYLSLYMFSLPCIYSFYKEQYDNTIFLIFYTVQSLLYWKNPTNCWKRDYYTMLSVIIFIMYYVNGSIYVKYIPYVQLSNSLMVQNLIFYYKYKKMLKYNEPKWYIYKIAFNFYNCCLIFIVLDSIDRSKVK